MKRSRFSEEQIIGILKEHEVSSVLQFSMKVGFENSLSGLSRGSFRGR